MDTTGHERHPISCAPLLVAGFGVPWQRDLDFGNRFVCCVEDLDWPDGVVVEDISYSALHALHRLQELRPAKVIVVTAASRGQAAPGTVRRQVIDTRPPRPDAVHRHLLEALSGGVRLEPILTVARHWQALPAGSVTIEIEPADTSIGLGLSERLAGSVDTVLAAVRAEIGGMPAGAATLSDRRIHSQLFGAPA